MTITLTSERDGRGWRCTASVPDVFTTRRYGASEIKSMEAALSTALRRIYEIMEDGQLALADVFPVLVDGPAAPVSCRRKIA